ncbi:MAG TPA: head maturation protease, ClpP-related [Moheibacter sp.]|nr:head maturation protease, ClpP-related [Moheibacter sp.]
MSRPKFHYEVKNQSPQVAEILLYGYIGKWEEFDYPRFQALFRDTLKSNKEITIRVHSGGGSVMEGLAIYDLIRGSDCKVTVIIEGMAASMGFIISLAGDVIKINENAFGMAHAVSGGCWGNKSDMLSYVEFIEQCETRLESILKERTKATAEQITEWLTTGKDYWLDAEKCRKLGIADEVIKPTKQRADQNDQTAQNIVNKTPEEAWECFNIQVDFPQNLNSENQMKKEGLLALMTAFGMQGTLTASSSDADFENALKGVFGKAKGADEAQNKLTEFAQERAEALVSAAVRDGKITGAEKEDWKKDAVSNYALVAKSLERMSGKPDPNAEVNRDIPKVEGQHELMNGREKWTFSEWQEKDPQGLGRLETEAKEDFEKLFNAEFK